jgi:hypothetical protein
MEFEIVIYIHGKPYRMRVKRIYLGDLMEKFEVNGGSRSIILRNNRPELKLKNSTKKPLWKIEVGEIPSNPQSFALTVLAIEKKIEEIEKRGEKAYC